MSERTVKVLEMAGLNVESVRNQNKIKVYAVKNVEYDKTTKKRNQPSSLVFSAYLTEPLGMFDAKVTQSSITEQLGKTLMGLGIVGEVMGSRVGKFAASLMSGERLGLGQLAGTGFDMSNLSSSVNYNFNWRFTGINEFSHQFKCMLVVKDDFITDVIEPLWSIIEYVLPDETRPLGDTTLYQLLGGAINTGYNKGKDWVNKKNVENPFIEPDQLEKVWKYIETIGGEVDDMAGSVTILKKPKQLQGGMSHTRITVGDYIEIDDVIIESVNFSVPFLFYEGGLFDNVGVTLTVKGNRKMTLKTYDWIKQLARTEGNLPLEPVQPKSIPLNDQFAPQLKDVRNRYRNR